MWQGEAFISLEVSEIQLPMTLFFTSAQSYSLWTRIPTWPLLHSPACFGPCSLCYKTLSAPPDDFSGCWVYGVFCLFVCFHVWFWPNALAEWRTELLYALIGAPFHSLMNVSNCLSLGQHYFQSTGGKVKSGKGEKQSMLHKGRAAQVELSAVGLCTSSEDKASHLEVFFHLLEWNYLSRLAQGSLQGNLSWGAVI